MITNTPEENRVGNISEFKQIADVTDEVFNLLMKWLISEKLATISTDSCIYKLCLYHILLKLKNIIQSFDRLYSLFTARSSNSKVMPLTESEICLCRITQATKQMHHTMEELDKKIETARNTAKAYIVKKNKALVINMRSQYIL